MDPVVLLYDLSLQQVYEARENLLGKYLLLPILFTYGIQWTTFAVLL